MRTKHVSIVFALFCVILIPTCVVAGVKEAAVLFDTYVKAVNENDIWTELNLFQQDSDVVSVINDHVNIGFEAVRRDRTASRRWTELEIKTARSYIVGPDTVFLFATVEFRDPAEPSNTAGTAALSLVIVETLDGWRIKHQHVSGL